MFLNGTSKHDVIFNKTATKLATILTKYFFQISQAYNLP